MVDNAGLAVVAATSLVSGRIAAAGHPRLRAVLDVAALTVLGYQTAIALDGVALLHAVAVLAPLASLVTGLDDPGAAPRPWSSSTRCRSSS